MTRTLVIASNNQHKLSEFRAILSDHWTVKGARDLDPQVTWDESGQTFLENARIKIAALRGLTNGYILADDSGLCVDGLGGAPGVHSSSFGGIEGDHPRNVEALLRAMNALPAGARKAHFYCLLLLSCPDGAELKFEGRCHGVIAASVSGDGGFGYDPVFVPDGHDRSMASMPTSLKNSISHRGVAAALLMSYLKTV
jgi:XTP/dITP diphosphohydrolase